MEQVGTPNSRPTLTCGPFEQSYAFCKLTHYGVWCQTTPEKHLGILQVAALNKGKVR